MDLKTVGLEILKLVYDYSRNGKLVDRKFVDKIIEIVVSKRELNDYVRQVVFKDGLEKTANGVIAAGYTPFSKQIVVNYESIQFILEQMGYYDGLFTDFEQIMFRNLTITQIILHELEHAYQFKQGDDKMDNSIETRLINASFMVELLIKNPKFSQLILTGEISALDFIQLTENSKELYKQYYKFNPAERLAQVHSYGTIISALEPIKGYVPNLYEFENASQVEEMLKQYPDSMYQEKCPTQVYLEGVGQVKLWAGFDFYDKNPIQLIENVKGSYTLKERLTLGLPISYDEVYNTESWLHSTNKFSV